MRHSDGKDTVELRQCVGVRDGERDVPAEAPLRGQRQHLRIAVRCCDSSRRRGSRFGPKAGSRGYLEYASTGGAVGHPPLQPGKVFPPLGRLVEDVIPGSTLAIIFCHRHALRARGTRMLWYRAALPLRTMIPNCSLCEMLHISPTRV